MSHAKKPKVENCVTNDSQVAKKDNSPYSYRDHPKLGIKLNIRELPWTEKQLELFRLIQDKSTKMVFIMGPAGVSKSLSAVYAGLQELNNKKIPRITYLRAAVESADSKLGMLPGEISSKIGPYTLPLMEKLYELLPENEVNKVLFEGHVRGLPISFLRGSNLNGFIIADELQSATYREIVTIMTRMHNYSKLILLADPYQTDLPDNKAGAFSKLYKIFSDEESKAMGIYTFEFGIEDIKRSDLVKFIVEKLDIYK